MNKKAKDIAKHELIGLSAEITDSKNKFNIGIKGKIIDETKTSIIIQNNDKRKRLFKKNIILKIRIKDQEKEIKGEKLFGKSKERIKK